LVLTWFSVFLFFHHAKLNLAWSSTHHFENKHHTVVLDNDLALVYIIFPSGEKTLKEFAFESDKTIEVFNLNGPSKQGLEGFTGYSTQLKTNNFNFPFYQYLITK
jgi:hypothetical protein